MSINTTDVNIPKIGTKQLQIQECKAGRKLVISTNFLVLFGFDKGCMTLEESLGTNKGIKITLVDKDTSGAKKVYTRTYANRKNNSLERLLDIRSQVVLNKSFPKDSKRVHVTFRYGELIIVPITERKDIALKQFKKSNRETFVVCSSGVDAISLVKKGFSVEALLDYRPNEKRDKFQDLTETGALNALANVPVNYLINEDIMNLDLDKIASLVVKSNFALGHLCITCDDFSNAKAASLKEKSLEDNSTTIDMVIDAINIIDKFKFPTLLLENVPRFFTSEAGKILTARLRRFGYEVYCDKYDARDYGGLTSRVRGYLFATLLPAKFHAPIPQPRNNKPFWDALIEDKIIDGSLRDVTTLKTTQAGIESGRARLITRTSLHSPTLMKSQTKFSKFYKKYFFPDTDLMASLMGIEMDDSMNGKVLTSEVLGQSIDVPLHEALLDSVNRHIDESDMIIKGKLF